MGGSDPNVSILVHYQELALKGRNRPWFVDRLLRNLREATAGLGVAEVRSLVGRVEVALRPGANVDEIRGRVARLFGIANFAVAERLEPDVAALERAVVRLTEGLSPSSFRVRVARADKRFPITSPDLERRLGGCIKALRGWHVDLDRPQLVVRVEIVPRHAFCYVGRDAGAGGLPTGVSGRVVCLISGGIDSPVAAWRMMRRGCRAALAHFHAYPLVSRASQEKARHIAEHLSGYQLYTDLWLVPFGDLQRQVVLSVPPPLRVVVYRRFMLRIAERIARRVRAGALVTGESVGQVASQTLDNIAAIGRVATLPVLRPLVGMDKEEIIAEAQRIGTYAESILPDEDCCQVFSPRRPSTGASLHEIARAEASLDIDRLVEAVVALAERSRVKG